MGSKAKIAKHILPIILRDRKPGQYYVEPFMGGGNMIDKVDGPRIGNDLNYHLIEMWKALQNGWIPPDNISEEEYKYLKAAQDIEDPVLVAWTGFLCSYGGKWFGGYINDYKEDRRSKAGVLPNHQKESKNSIVKQTPFMKGVELYCESYDALIIPPRSIIYCDPPYRGTTGYKNKFDNDLFWEWCRQKTREGHLVYISEYSAPEDFICIKEIEHQTQLANGSNSGNKLKIEKLFTLI